MATQEWIDQMGRRVAINIPPQRIISLVPSQTELLFDLGLGDSIVGITRFCTHPEKKVSAILKIGGTKHFEIEKIKVLKPDLIIGNKEENYLEGIEQLNSQFPVWMSDIVTLEDSYQMIRAIGEITDTQERAVSIVSEIKAGFESLAPTSTAKSAAYFIWRKPYMIAASGTFINEMMQQLGLKNVFDNEARYPAIEPSALAALQPDFIFLSSEPYAFREQHIAEFQAFCPSAEVLIVDGELFSWYGSRLRYSAAFFHDLRLRLGF